MPKDIKEYTSPAHKIIAMLHEGRNKLRKKYTELRRQHRVAENQIRAVEKSREMWRQRAKAAEAALAEKKRNVSGVTVHETRLAGRITRSADDQDFRFGAGEQAAPASTGLSTRVTCSA